MTTSPRTSRHRRPVFLDESGVRWRWVRRFTVALGVVTTALYAVLAIAVIIPPSVPDLALADAPATRTPKLVTSRKERLRLAKRLQLWFSLEANHPPPAMRAQLLPVKGKLPPGKHREPGQPIVAGFYVNWDDNSLVALRAHANDLDWVVCEWGFLYPGGDSLRLRIDRKVPFSLARDIPNEKDRPQLFLMLSSFDSASKKWDAKSLRHMLTNPTARANAIRELSDSVYRYGLAGVTLDFEEVPSDLTESIVSFAKALKAEIGPKGRLVTQAVSFNDTEHQLARYASINDKLFLMLYDEHFGGRGDPGPVASQQWFVRTARRMLRTIPPDKAILTVGAYGYDWNDGDSVANAQAVTFQEMMSAVRNTREEGRPAGIYFDSLALNPYARWTDADSTDHLSWYLDAVAAYNQFQATRQLGAAGQAIWRLGSEDPAIWNVIGKEGIDASPYGLDSIPAGY
ncbi:MAG TPA: glycosyl hydrolase family 18 protein, partial [Gemmatimonadaceae bacterium]|nr:glycosyl hydrolase family 18 protein [Gemmatimonadaceae bacterium]